MKHDQDNCPHEQATDDSGEARLDRPNHIPRLPRLPL